MKKFFLKLDAAIQKIDVDYIVMAFCVLVGGAVGTMAVTGML